MFAQVRESVLRALGTSGATAALPCFEEMVLRLKDDCCEVQGQAAVALCRLAAEAPESFDAQRVGGAVAPLLAAQGVRDAAAEALVALGDVAAPLVVSYVLVGEKLERQKAVEVLRELGRAERPKSIFSSIYHIISVTYIISYHYVQCMNRMQHSIH